MPRLLSPAPSLPSLPRRWRLVALVLALAAGPACADTVWLDNGDRLTGTIQSLDNGYLLIHTDYGGDLRIAFDHVKTLQSDTPLVIRDASMAHDYRAKLVSAEPGTVVLDGVRREADIVQPVKEDVPLKSLESLVRPRPFLRETSVTGHVDLAANKRTASNDTQDYSATLNTTIRHGWWRHQFNGAYLHSREDDGVNTNNLGMDYTLDRFLTEKAFWQVRLMHRRDWVEDLNRQTAYGTGPGYQFWDNELGAFSLSALLGRVHYGYSDGSSDAAYAGSLRWDYVRYFSGKEFELFTKGELMRPFEGDARIAINGEAGVRYNVNSWMSLYLKYARSQVSSTFQSLNESIYSTGLGVHW
ncbi:DUF481 domain-containing protein [Bordetella sp. BOR01]|uniref:DUF481 domain-containing protein n=1 Tax=Bordetella sp. BOR01 TaxID=2854779 RepID=UPI001C44E21F|nr:DUF481 domain-containing protein [Bordetella sp. BOR01]MBV7483746.1 DUF481 domain-containing protein [Bordetella sp. BOR01]